MGVYIEGMEMPKDDCEAYRQIIITNNLVDGKIQMLAHDANTNEFIGEVVELPPHGRLIDADALANSEDCKRKGCVYQEEIFRAPTIIQASEEET